MSPPGGSDESQLVTHHCPSTMLSTYSTFADRFFFGLILHGRERVSRRNHRRRERLKPRKAVAARKDLEFSSLYGVAVIADFCSRSSHSLCSLFTVAQFLPFNLAFRAPRRQMGKDLLRSAYWHNCGIPFAPYSLACVRLICRCSRNRGEFATLQ